MSSPVARQYSAVSQAENSERIRSDDSGIGRIRSADSAAADHPPQYQVLTSQLISFTARLGLSKLNFD